MAVFFFIWKYVSIVFFMHAHLCGNQPQGGRYECGQTVSVIHVADIKVFFCSSVWWAENNSRPGSVTLMKRLLSHMRPMMTPLQYMHQSSNILNLSSFLLLALTSLVTSIVLMKVTIGLGAFIQNSYANARVVCLGSTECGMEISYYPAKVRYFRVDCKGLPLCESA